jgi:hypothetical membrane protein
MIRRMTRAYAGIAAPLIVMLVLLVQGATTPNYDPIRQTISELGTGWRGTRVVGVYGFFVITCVWEPIAKRLPTNLSVIGLVVCLLAVGIGCVGLSEVPAESGSWNSMTWRGRLHLIFAFGFIFAFIPLACLSGARALPAAWRGLRAYSLATGVVCLAILIGALWALSQVPPSRAVVANLGAIERVYVFAFMTWQCIVSAAVVRSAGMTRR